MRKFVVPVVAAATVLVASGVAVASIPGADGVIHGCYTQGTGTLRVINLGAKQSCGTNEHALSWSQTGPKGDPGPQGPPGPSGGASGYEVDSCNVGLQLATNGNPLCIVSVGDSFASVVLGCPAGKVALSGGYQNTSGNFSLNQVPFEMYPTSSGAGEQFTFGSPNVSVMNVYVTCANEGGT